MGRSSTPASFKTLPADLRRLIEDTEDSMNMLYRSVDNEAQRTKRKLHKSSRSTSHGHASRRHRHRPSSEYSTDSDFSDDGGSDEDEQEERLMAANKRHGLRSVAGREAANEPVRYDSASSDTQDSTAIAASHSLSAAPVGHRGQPLPQPLPKTNRSASRRENTVPPSPRASRAYRRVTYADDVDEADEDEEAYVMETDPQATRVSAAPPSLLYTTKRPSSVASAPVRQAANGLCESLLPGNGHQRAMESISVLSRSSAVQTESTTPTRMLTQFGHRWDDRYRHILDQVVDNSTEKSGLSGATSPARPTSGDLAATAASTTNGSVEAPNPNSLDQLRPAQPQRPFAGPLDGSSHRASPSTLVVTQPPPASPSDEQLAAVMAQRDALQESLRAREQALLEMERRHLDELAAVRNDVSKAKLEGAQEAREHLATSASLKESILQAALETERQRTADAVERAKEAEKAQRELRRRVDEQETNLALQTRTSALREQDLDTLRERVSSLEAQLTRATAERQDAEEAARRAHRDQQSLQDRLDAATREHEALERHLGDQDGAAKAALKSLEAEFEETTARYQTLLDEATRRVEHLEKVQRKYKSLKDTHQRVAETTEETTTSLRRQVDERDDLVESLRKELQAVQGESLKQQELLKAKDNAHDEKVRSLQRQLELKGASSDEQVKTLQQHLETATHTIELLRTQIDSLKEEVREEQMQTQQANMRLAQVEMRLKEEVLEQQRDAATAKTRHNEVITALKQQLKEKNAKLEALAASSMEPLQRLREQLESERGKRAHLEEQLSRFKKRAKEAEEAALRELRREQLRQSTEAAALLLTPAATPRQSPTPNTEREAVGSASVLNSAQRHTPSTYASVPSWALQPRREREGRLTASPHGSRLGGANAPSDAPSTVNTPHAAIAEEEEDQDRRTQRQQQGNRSLSSMTHVREGSHSPPQVQTTAIVELSVPRPGEYARESEGSPSQALAPAAKEAVSIGFHPSQPPSLGAWQEARQRRLPPPPSRLSRSHTATTSTARATTGTVRSDPDSSLDVAHAIAPPYRRVTSRELPSVVETRRTDGELEPRMATGTQDRSRMSPATVGSLSGISRSSPCNSTSGLNDDVSEGLRVDDGDTNAPSGQLPPSPRSRTASPSATGQLVTPAAVRSDNAPGQGAVVPSTGHMLASAEGESEHDHRMREFHASAAEVMRRISGSRDEFMSRCAQVIQRSSALGAKAAFDDGQS